MGDLRQPLPPNTTNIHRKPLPNYQPAYSIQSSDAPSAPQQLARRPSGPAVARARTPTNASSNSMQYPMVPPSPYVMKPPMPHPHAPGAPPPPAGYSPTRRPSSGTASITSNPGNNFSPVYPATSTGRGGVDIQRSSSARSAATNAPLGYVALMRRQKATVWCDRAQPEDPRIRAQKLADKKRAYREINVAGSRGGIYGSKNKSKDKGPTEVTPSTLVTAVVPPRLSANEVGDDGDDEAPKETDVLHRRPGSGPGSLGSKRYLGGYQRPTTATMGSFGSMGSMGSMHSMHSMGASGVPGEKTDLPEVVEKQEVEQQSHANQGNDDDDDNSIGSEPEDSFGTLGEMSAPSAAQSATQKAQRADELKRRGSVDDRTTSLTRVRLFVANPDLSD